MHPGLAGTLAPGSATIRTFRLLICLGALAAPDALLGCARDAWAEPPTPPGSPAPGEAFEKAARSAAERKIDSQLLYALRARRGDPGSRGGPAEAGVEVDGDGRVLVDIRAEVTPAMVERVRELGGVIVSTSERHRSVVARLPLEHLEDLAAASAVHFIQPAPRGLTHGSAPEIQPTGDPR